jgi:heparosan-N-sulfate-glucuronate 5-epimerase
MILTVLTTKTQLDRLFLPLRRPIAATLPENRKIAPGYGIYDRENDKRDPFCRAFALELPYLRHEHEYVAKFRDAGIAFDDRGVPINTFRWGGPYYYSVTIGHHGLSELARYIKTGNEEHFEKCMAVFMWLMLNQNESGAWSVDYDHNWFPPRCEIIKSPWTSAMGQGLCVSFLARFYHHVCKVQKKPSFIDEAKLCGVILSALRPFDVASADGGCLAKILDRYTCYEEYPTSPASCVLNGFMFSLFGLKDAARFTKNAVPERLYRDGVEGLFSCLPFFDHSRSTTYDLTHITCHGFQPNTARYNYHFIHLQLLSALNFLENGRFNVWVERWWLYLHGFGDRGN